jgi:stage II sporulation protein D
MRRVLVAAIALVVALTCVTAAWPAATFVIKGKGWGHGIGLAQYGAYGFAQHGRNSRWILDHYYPGTTLGTAGVGRVRVLLARNAGSLSIGSGRAFTVRDANGRTFNLAAGAQVLGPNLRVRTANGQRRTLASPVRFSPGASLLRLSGDRYRGLLRVRSRGGRLSAVNDVGLEPYVKGVVAWEMPSDWHPEALKAQAVVARTFGLVSRKSGWFDLHDDTRSQVYGGVRAETDSTNAAVNATRGRVVRWHGELAWTLYHSTSGGKTASRRDEWGLSGMPYLASVNDPYDRISPHHTWGPDAYEDCAGSGRDCVWSAGALKRALGGRAPGSIRDFRVVTRNGSSRVERTRLGPSGAVISGADLRTILGLRSTWFSIGVLRLTGGGSIDEGQSTTLHALKRNLSRVVLQRKVGSGAWTRVRDIHGRQNVSVSPNATTSYRLRSPAAVGRAVKVKVVQSPRLAAFAVAPGVYRVRVLDGRTSP